jgi:UDP-glucose 4-epimerase
MILVTGGTGYIGSHTCVALIEKGHEVVIVDNLSNSNISVLDGIEKITGIRPNFVKGDVKDKNTLTQIFVNFPGIEAVIHFAAFKAVGESVNKPLDYYENNVGGLVSLLQVMEENKINNLVFSSSCTVYGQPKNLPVDESSPVGKAESPYGNTKKINEEIISDTAQSGNGLKAISLRYFNPIGAHPSALIGELPVGTPNNLLPFITQTAFGVRDKLQVFGNNYNTPDGTCIRDYININDLANAHIIALKYLLTSSLNYEVFNLGTGKGVSVLEIIRSFEKTTKKQLNYSIGERRDGDIEQIWADASKANKILKWQAQTGLDETINSAWKWEQYYRKNNQLQ